MSRKDSVLEPKSAILIVEDDMSLASNLQDVLEKEGYSAAVACDGQTALTQCAEQVFDLALIDIKLPDALGVDLVEKLTELSPMTEYIIITGYPSLETAVAAIGQKRIVGYETKPLDMGRLTSLIRQFTERKWAEGALRESEQKLRLMFESVTDGIAVTDLSGIVTEVNERVVQMFGCGCKDEVLGRSAFEFIAQRDCRRAAVNIQKTLKRGSVRDIEYTLVKADGSECPGEIRASVQKDASANTVGFIAVIKDITERKQAQEKLRRSYEKLQRAMEGTKQAFALTTEMRDPYTSGHQRRVTRLACAIASEMGVSKERIEGIDMAGSVHDIGKMYVPTEILCKPGRLTEVEFSLIKVHPQAGHDILRTVEFTGPIAQIVLQHHERMNGSGYPSGLSGEDILLEARILAVADVVEAMSSHRPYRPGYVVDKALLEIVQKKGVLYDCNAVDACMSVFTEKGFKFD